MAAKQRMDQTICGKCLIPQRCQFKAINQSDLVNFRQSFFWDQDMLVQDLPGSLASSLQFLSADTGSKRGSGRQSTGMHHMQAAPY